MLRIPYLLVGEIFHNFIRHVSKKLKDIGGLTRPHNSAAMLKYKKMVRSDEAFLTNKVYSFQEPLPPPYIQEIYSNSEFTDPLPRGDHKSEPPKEDKKPTWLVRGDLSSVSAVDDMLQLK